jgi:predicted Holliday junction resolvase-like endonuclease|tara:strand:- start:66 stop:332 length:267 start_codon:yes stop_codon:yes gene_type:complete
MIIEIAVVLGVISIVQLYVIVNLYIKCDNLEQWIDSTYLQIQNTLQEMRDLDAIGAFESDDEVGEIFKSLEESLNKLDNITEEPKDAA